tara:strand:- start:16 stop:564 length:549 start_codon:yes stop_codon:yes gene_type:complete
MMLAMTLAASLAQAWTGGLPDKPAGPEISGRYAELQASGVSGCNTAGVPRTLDIHILAAPPHDRSANIGEMAYDLGEGDAPGGSFTVAGQPERTVQADGSWRVSIGGGWVHTAGRYVDGTTDGQLRGRVEVELDRLADGTLRLVSITETERRNGAGTPVVTDGRLPDGTELRPFARCGDASR